MSANSEEPLAPSAATPGAPEPTPEPAAPAAGTGGSSSEATPATPAPIDFDRMIDDAEYASKVETDRAATSASTDQEKTTDGTTEPAAPAAGAAPAPAPGAPAKEDADPIVATILVEGKEEPVRKSEHLSLLQKGRYSDKRFGRAGHLLSLERDAPDIAALLRTPEGRAKVFAAVRAAKAPGAAPTTAKPQPASGEGDIDPSDLEVIDKRVEARALEILQRAGITVPTAEEATQQQVLREEAGRKVVATLEAMQEVDPDFAGTRAAMDELLEEIHRSQPPDQVRRFVAAIDNPLNVHPETGKPLFLHFVADARRWKAQRAAAGAARPPAGATPAGPGAPATPPATPPAPPTPPARRPAIRTTLEPGSPTLRKAPGAPPNRPDFKTMSAAQRLAYFDAVADGGV